MPITLNQRAWLQQKVFEKYVPELDSETCWDLTEKVNEDDRKWLWHLYLKGDKEGIKAKVKELIAR